MRGGGGRGGGEVAGLAGVGRGWAVPGLDPGFHPVGLFERNGEEVLGVDWMARVFFFFNFIDAALVCASS